MVKLGLDLDLDLDPDPHSENCWNRPEVNNVTGRHFHHFVFNLTPFASNLSYICLSGFGSVFGIPVRIRIHKGPEYGSNLDPDPQHWTVSPPPVVVLHVVLEGEGIRTPLATGVAPHVALQ